MDAIKNASTLQQIAAGELSGVAAVTALREALTEIHAAEAGLAQWRALVASAEIALIYGSEGRPQRFGPSFIERAG